MKWFVSLLFLCITLLTWHSVSAADQWNVPTRPWVTPPSPDWWPPPPAPGAAAESAEIEALREQVRALRSESVARGMSLEEMRGHLFAALRERDHWWAQVQWLWEQGRRNSAMAWTRVVELESALAQSHRSRSAMAEALAALRARVQATQGELAERDGRIRVMEREQAALNAALEQRRSELQATRDSLLAENTRLRNDLNRVRSQLAEAADGAWPQQEVAHAKGAAGEIAVFETEPPWQRQASKARGQRPVPTAIPQGGETAGLAAVSSRKRPVALADDLHAVRMDRDYLEARLQEVLSEREALTSSLSSARLTLQQSTADAEAQSAEITSLREQASALRDMLQSAGERLELLVIQRDRDQEHIGALQTENARLIQRQLMAQGAEAPVARLDTESKAEMVALRQAIAALERDLSLARGQRVPSAGRVADPEIVQARAAELGDSYELVYTGAESLASMKTEVIADLDRLSDDLFREQSLLAHAVAANGVYKVLPHDSLSRIAYKVYGTGKRWPDIYAANDHLLENPDALLPGLVLVIP